MRSDLLSILHDDPIGGHVGSRKMFAIAALRFYWPEMREPFGQGLVGIDDDLIFLQR